MSESPRKIAGVPIDAFVKGGTTTQRWDHEKKKFYAETDERRAHEDQKRAVVAASAGRPDTRSAILSLNLDPAGKPKVCLTYKSKDNPDLDRQALCELAIYEAGKMLLALVCPRCLERTGRMHDSQVIIRSEHREFWLDTSRAGVWVEPTSGLSYQLAGTVTTKDLLTCSALGCNWQFRIENSILYGSDRYRMSK